jgi:sugar phosphate isomerase/epimerase
MRFSLATIVLAPRGESQSMPWPHPRKELFAWAAAAGFQSVEFSSQWMDLSLCSDADLRTMRDDLADAGLSASGLNVNRCILTRTGRAGEHFSLVRRAINAAAILQASLVTVSLSMPRSSDAQRSTLRGCDVPDAEQKAAARLVTGLADEAGSLGVELSLELHDDGLLDSAELCLRMLDRVGRANVGVNPDLGNICRNPDSPCDWQSAIKQLAPFANCWHVKNFGAANRPLSTTAILITAAPSASCRRLASRGR